MPPDTPNPARATVRVPFEAEVVVEFDRFSGFLAEYSSNLSLGGMFLSTRYLKPVGSELRFEIRLKDAAPLVRGRGMVAWTRWLDQGPRRPAGMGVRFLDLDTESRELVYKIVDERLKAGDMDEELAFDPATLAEISAPPSVESLADPPMPLPDAARGIALEIPTPPPTPLAPEPPEDEVSPVVPPHAEAKTPRADVPRLEEIVAHAAAAWTPAPVPPLPPPPPVVPRPPAPRITPAVPAAGARPARRTAKPGLAAALILLALGAAAAGWWLVRSRISAPASAPPATVAAQPAAAPSEPVTQPAARSEPATSSTVQPSVAAAVAPALAGAVPAAPQLARFTGLEKVTWSEENGFTQVVLWLDGGIPAGSFERSSIAGKEPRELVRLRGASHPVAAGRFDVDTPEVRRVRTGLHGTELHVVVDLAAGARVFESQIDGNRLVLRVAFR